MGISSRLLRLPRPQKFLYTMSLSTGASLITLSLLVNKVSGLYGILALFTGFKLSPIQLSMYIYSIFALVLTAYLAPHIRKQSPLQCVALALFYVLDSIVNAAYTAAFAVSWFLIMAQHNAGEKPTTGVGAGTIVDTAGFTSPQFNVTDVEIDPSASNPDAAMIGTPADAPAGANGTLGHAVLSSESLNSIGVIITLWTIRVYFCVVMLAYARFVLRQHIALASAKNASYTTASASTDLAENPFGESKPEGQGWAGKLGRFMLSLGRSYWLGSDDDDNWMKAMGGKFRRGEEGVPLAKIDAGPSERERRRRSGTGPPVPSTQLQTPGQKTLNVPQQNL